MKSRLVDIAPVRLRHQKLAAADGGSPAAVVRWLGAVQAQDYAGARWALGLRVKGATDHAVARAFDAGAILRTHMLRPTWHFVAPEDIRWIQTLTAPRVHAATGRITASWSSTKRSSRKAGRLRARPGGRRPPDP